MERPVEESGSADKAGSGENSRSLFDRVRRSKAVKALALAGALSVGGAVVESSDVEGAGHKTEEKASEYVDVSLLGVIVKGGSVMLVHFDKAGGSIKEEKLGDATTLGVSAQENKVLRSKDIGAAAYLLLGEQKRCDAEKDPLVCNTIPTLRAALAEAVQDVAE